MPPPWKPMRKKALLALPELIETLLDAEPEASASRLWGHIVDTTDIEVSFRNVGILVAERRATRPLGITSDAGTITTGA